MIVRSLGTITHVASVAGWPPHPRPGPPPNALAAPTPWVTWINSLQYIDTGSQLPNSWVWYRFYLRCNYTGWYCISCTESLLRFPSYIVLLLNLLLLILCYSYYAATFPAPPASCFRFEAKSCKRNLFSRNLSLIHFFRTISPLSFLTKTLELNSKLPASQHEHWWSWNKRTECDPAILTCALHSLPTVGRPKPAIPIW